MCATASYTLLTHRYFLTREDEPHVRRAVFLDEVDQFVESHLKRHPLNAGNVEHVHPSASTIFSFFMTRFLRPRHQAELTDEFSIHLCRLISDCAIQPCKGDAVAESVPSLSFIVRYITHNDAGICLCVAFDETVITNSMEIGLDFVNTIFKWIDYWYLVENNILTLTLVETGTHADIFDE